MLESDYSLALSINLLRIPFKIQRVASRRCHLDGVDILPISCTLSEIGFTHFPLQNTYRNCCASPLGIVVASLYDVPLAKRLEGRCILVGR